MLVNVRLHPGASREALKVVADGALEAWVRQRPVEGQANEALLRLLAGRLDVAPSAVLLVRGTSGRAKVVEVPLGTWDELVERLARSAPGPRRER